MRTLISERHSFVSVPSPSMDGWIKWMRRQTTGKEEMLRCKLFCIPLIPVSVRLISSEGRKDEIEDLYEYFALSLPLILGSY